MKRIVLSLVIVVVALGATAPPAHSIGAWIGYWDAKDDNDAWGLGVKHDFLKVVPLVSFDIRAAYYKFDSSATDTNAIPLGGTAKVDFGLFFAGLGLDYMFLNNGYDNRWSWAILGGVKLALGGLGVYGELIYRNPEGSDFDGWGINVGVLLGVF